MTQPPRGPGIDPGVSSYLNLLRVAAAITVLLSHYLPVLFDADRFLVPGHDAVIVFFVMSGYIIAYVAQAQDRPLRKYLVHRLARLWSVLIPALGLSLLVALLVGDATALDTAPPIHAPAAFASAALRTALFLGEGWVGTVPAPYNAPVWSLNYEAWYYLVFAAYTFSAPRWRWLASIGALVLAGPGIAALFPCWLLGALLFHRQHRLSLRPTQASLVFIACVLLYACAYRYDLTLRSRHWLSVLTYGQSYHLGAATSVIGDIMLAPLVAASIIAVRHMPLANRTLARMQGFTKAASSRTLSIYLFHTPVLVLLTSWAGLGQGGVGQSGAGATACLLLGFGACLLLGNYTEAQLGSWRRGLFRLVGAPAHQAQPP